MKKGKEIRLGFQTNRALLGITYERLCGARATQRVVCVVVCKILFYVCLENPGYGLDEDNVQLGFAWPKR